MVFDIFFREARLRDYFVIVRFSKKSKKKVYPYRETTYMFYHLNSCDKGEGILITISNISSLKGIA